MKKIYTALALILMSVLGSHAWAITPVNNFGNNPGNLNMYKYVPSGSIPDGTSLVLVAHGCSQTAASYEEHTEWSVLAEQYKFYVVYPEQKKGNNNLLCFNWFDPADYARGRGEMASIESMIDKMFNDYPKIDPAKIYVTGVSGGGGIVGDIMISLANMGNGRVIAGGGFMSTIPGYAANDAWDGIMVWKGFKDLAPQAWGNKFKNANAGYTGPFPKVVIFYGEEDEQLNYLYHREIMEQWTNIHGVDQTPEVDDTFRGATRKIYHDDGGEPIAVTYVVPGMTHGVALDPCSANCNPDQGGKVTDKYSHDVDIYSSYYTAVFWGLISEVPEELTITIDNPNNGDTVRGTVNITATAAGGTQPYTFALYIDGVHIPEADMSGGSFSYAWDATDQDGNHTIRAEVDDETDTAADEINVTVDNTIPDVDVQITSPANGSNVSGTITVAATATADLGVDRVVFNIGGTNQVDNTAPYGVDVDTTDYDNGLLSITATVYDTQNNDASDSIVVTVDNPLCSEYWANNYEHVNAGRAYFYFGSVYANGSNNYMGLYNIFTNNWLKTRDGSYFEVGECQ